VCKGDTMFSLFWGILRGSTHFALRLLLLGILVVCVMIIITWLTTYDLLAFIFLGFLWCAFWALLTPSDLDRDASS
jgi:hypothetical protein